MASAQGCTVFRNNTMGVFDGSEAVRKIWNLIQSTKVTTAELRRAIASSYRVSHEQKGASDILGYSPAGRFIAIEIKAKGDKLDKDGNFNQENFLKEVGQRGGLSFLVCEEPQKVKLRVIGSANYITVCNQDDFLILLIQKLKQPYA
jgi:penicillin-binding protein-related factor A (putative recombinase)